MFLIPIVLAAFLLVIPQGNSSQTRDGEKVPSVSSAQVLVSDDVAKLIPADTHVIVRMESMQAALDLINTLAKIPSAEPPPLTASLLLGQLDLAGDFTKIAADKPFFVSLNVGPTGNLMTAVLPVVDGPGYIASLPRADAASRERGWVTASSGGYVGVTRRPGYAAAATPSAMAKQFLAGTASVHVDMKALIATFRPTIEMLLEMVEGQMDQAAKAQGGPFDMNSMFEAYIDGIWAFMDSAERLDLALGLRERSLELSGGLTTLEGSTLAGLGGKAGIDLTAFPGSIQPDTALAMVVGCDWKRLLEQFGSFLDAVVGMYPEPMGAAFDSYMKAFSELYGMMGPVVTASGDIGPDGMRFIAYVQGEKPAEMLAAMEKAIGSFGGEGTAMRSTGPERTEIGGIPVVQYRLAMDFEELSALAGTEADEDAVKSMRDMMTAFWGKDGLRMGLAAKGDLFAMVVGGDAAFLSSSLAQLGGAKKPLPADLQRAVAAANGGSPAVVYRLDYGRLFSQMRSMGDLFGELPMGFSALPDLPLPVTFWGSIRGRVWNGGLSTNLDDLTAFTRAAVDEGPHAAEEDR